MPTPFESFRAPQPTGRRIVTFAPERVREGLARVAELELEAVEYAADDAFLAASTQVFPTLGIVVVGGDPASVRAAADALGELGDVEPELVVEAWPAYLDGYRDGVNDAVGRASSHLGAAVAAASARADADAEPAWEDDDHGSWGLKAIGIGGGCGTGTGAGVTVAVLDTGVDLQHPDLADRVADSHSFVPGAAVQDGHGHGTHCCGTVAGPVVGAGGAPRYGVAPGVRLLVGKVLSDAGRGSTAGILAGIQWAVDSGAKVVSLSLGSPVYGPDQGYSPAYERIAQYALERGAILIAAAGNDSYRNYGIIAPVGSPANCPSVLAVGAIDRFRRIARFSCGGLYGDGGEVDIAAPGVDVFSAWTGGRYRAISGTSMACPHVSGVAALWAEAGHTGPALWQALTGSGVAVEDLPPRDVGTGLVQVP